MKTYYTLFQLSADATADQIETAYRRMHNELSSAGSSTEQIDRAYAVLSDPQQRRAYDARIAPARGGISRRELLLTFGGALVGLLIIGVVWALAGRTAEPELPTVGEMRRPAPAIALPGLDGETIRFSDLRGRVVLVNFWGTWCEPCKEETPALQNAYEALRDDGLVIVGVNLHRQEPDEAAIRAFAEQYNVSYPIALDVDGEAARLFQISPIPTSYFIDPAGDIRYVRVGTLTYDEVETLFLSLQQTASAHR
ncbi:MAG TPA: redoxin domain-containing protein [Roseiflexaceae bacterium]|nr:redoxin domain-containing protein [Roseiflexaceae bacterium]HMP42947.1 redoxin domain-containing protein [Roseiflexaceae bacterium]